MTQQPGGGHAGGRRPGHCAHGGADAEDLADLDALVDALIDAELAADGRAAGPESGAEPAAAPNVIVPRHWRAAPRTVARPDAHDGCCGGDDGPCEAAEMLRPATDGDLDSDPDLETDPPLDFAAADAPAGDEDDCFRLERICAAPTPSSACVRARHSSPAS